MKKIIILLFFITFSSYSQEKEIKTYNPKKASRLSAVLPGLGQVYNKQYWKVPVIYGGYAVIGHYIKFNNQMYIDFKNALILETDNDELTLNPFPNFNRTSLERNMDFWRRNRDMLIIFTGAYYLLNIVDAHIFAHLNEFDNDNNLDLSIKPSLEKINNTNLIGISLYLNF
ncbi:MAG: hypothetical protein CL870_04770 [Cytophagia bacterium]|jgi:hypothetical protein|nr:hypothetical protein [Cytophagia bacterium]